MAKITEVEINTNFKGCDSDLQIYQKYKIYNVKCKLSGEYDTGSHRTCLKQHSK